MESVFKFFNYTDRVDSPRIPFEIIRSLSWVAEYLFGEKCYTVVRLDPEYNYSIVSCRSEFARLKWGKFSRDSVSKNCMLDDNTPEIPNVLLLGFPSPDAGSTLVHALAAHEFGHEFFYKHSEQFAAIQEELFSEIIQDHRLVLQEYLEGVFLRLPTDDREHAMEKGRKSVFCYSSYHGELAERDFLRPGCCKIGRTRLSRGFRLNYRWASSC